MLISEGLCGLAVRGPVNECGAGDSIAGPDSSGLVIAAVGTEVERKAHEGGGVDRCASWGGSDALRSSDNWRGSPRGVGGQDTANE